MTPMGARPGFVSRGTLVALRRVFSMSTMG